MAKRLEWSPPEFVGREFDRGFSKFSILCTFCKEEGAEAVTGSTRVFGIAGRPEGVVKRFDYHAMYKEGTDEYIDGVSTGACFGHMGRLTTPKVLDPVSPAMAKQMKEMLSTPDEKKSDGLYDSDDD